MFDRRWLLSLAFALLAPVVESNPATAGVLDASWIAPTANTDGSSLTDLASYRVYYSTSGSPCPGSTFFQVSSSTSAPAPNQLVSFRLTGLTSGQTYSVSVTAVDAGGLESTCSPPASAVAQLNVSVTPGGTVGFGNVNVGSSATQTFTIQNMRSGTVTGSASVGAPFTIMSGSPFTLVGSGATATVTVRFAPTSSTMSSTNVNFITADGDTVSRLVTGTGVGTTSTLTVAKAGTGSGTVTSSPAGISCGATCSATYTNGTPVTLTAAAATGSTFAGWSGGGCSGIGTCSVTVSTATSVTATFTAPTFALTVTRSGNGGGTVTSSPAGINCGTTCSASYTSGTTVTLTAAPSGGSIFGGWTGSCTGTTSTCTVAMSAARSVTATFSLPSFALTVTKAGTGSGTVTSSPAGIDCGTVCSTSFTSGTMVTLTAVPVGNSLFAGWSGSCTGTTTTCTVSMTAARAATATFNTNPNAFSDNPLVAGTTVIKATHIGELRTAVSAARARNGLPAVTWTDPTLSGGMIKAIHISELRAALNAVYTKLSRTLPSYTDPTIVPGQTASKAAHVQELRNAVSVLP
jgi:hypothetical protein